MAIKDRTNQPSLTLTSAGASALLALCAGTLHAQDALGSGNVLDANPGQYGASSTFTRPSLADEIKFRNAISTGNAPGGMSFRGDVGYLAPGDFSGELGSDSIFSFRRDSLYSGLAGMGIRGTDALQYQFSLTTGAAPPKDLIGTLSFSRNDQYSIGAASQFPSGYSSNVAIAVNRQEENLDPTGQALSARINNPGPGVTGLDTGSMMGTLRSSSTYNTTSTMQPSLMSVYDEGLDRRPVGLIASPLLGVTPTPLADEEPKPTNPLVARPANADTDPTVPGGLPSTRVTTSYDELVDQMRERVQQLREEKDAQGASSSIQAGESNDAWLARQMAEIRNQLYGIPITQDPQDPNAPQDPANPDATDPAAADPSATDGAGDTEPGTVLPDLVTIPDSTDSPLAQRLAEGQERLEELNREFELSDPTQIAIDPETMKVLRGSAADEVETLLVPGANEDDLYAKHIGTGERLIAAGRYFDAEERFSHALTIRPNDKDAQQGRLHAQIGAGMLLSASVNLQDLYSKHPELVARRYAGNLLPGEERLQALIKRLGERAGIIDMEIRTRPLEGDRVRVSAALLYAYIGYQTGDQAVVDAGLNAMGELGTESDQRFASLLKQLWVVPDAKGTP